MHSMLHQRGKCPQHLQSNALFRLLFLHRSNSLRVFIPFTNKQSGSFNPLCGRNIFGESPDCKFNNCNYFSNTLPSKYFTCSRNFPVGFSSKSSFTILSALATFPSAIYAYPACSMAYSETTPSFKAPTSP